MAKYPKDIWNFTFWINFFYFIKTFPSVCLKIFFSRFASTLKLFQSLSLRGNAYFFIHKNDERDDGKKKTFQLKLTRRAIKKFTHQKILSGWLISLICLKYEQAKVCFPLTTAISCVRVNLKIRASNVERACFLTKRKEQKSFNLGTFFSGRR